MLKKRGSALLQLPPNFMPSVIKVLHVNYQQRRSGKDIQNGNITPTSKSEDASCYLMKNLPTGEFGKGAL
jgi:hypothetical protein